MKRSGTTFRLGVTALLVLNCPTAQAAPPTPPPTFEQPNAYAVVIGISQYREEVIPKVAYAVKDAEAIAQLLETQGGIPKTNIKLLTDTKATIGDFRNHFGDWLRMRVKPDSTVYVYYSGHGTPNPKTGEAYFVPWDGHPDFPSGLYPVHELYETLNKLPAKEVIVLLDSCFSGAPGRSVLPRGARPVGISVENPLLAGGKIVVLAAATGSQISSDYEKAEHGLFSFYLLAGLRGEADTDRDGVVTLREVFPYVRESVARTAVEEINREQTPVLLPGAGEEVFNTRIALPLSRAATGWEALRVLARKRTDREKAGFLGPVRTVIVESARLFHKSGRQEEGPRTRDSATTYDVSGSEIEVIDYFSDGGPQYKTVKVYDTLGNLVEQEAQNYGPDSSGPDKVAWSYNYKTNQSLETQYDAKGKLVSKEVFTWNVRGNRVEKIDLQGNIWESFIYDVRGNEIEHGDDHAALIIERALGRLSPSHSLPKNLYSYDVRGNMVEQTHFDGDGSIFSKTTNSYDRQGNLTESRTRYVGKTDKPDIAYSYAYLEFDSHGNWTKSIYSGSQIVCDREGKKACKPREVKEVEYRTITYH